MDVPILCLLTNFTSECPLRDVAKDVQKCAPVSARSPRRLALIKDVVSFLSRELRTRLHQRSDDEDSGEVWAWLCANGLMARLETVSGDELLQPLRQVHKVSRVSPSSNASRMSAASCWFAWAVAPGRSCNATTFIGVGVKCLSP